MKQILFMNKEICKNLSGYELATYCVLLSLLKPDDYILYIHTEMIEMEIANSTTIPKCLINMIKESLESLIEKLSLTVIEVSKNKKKYILDCRNLYMNKDFNQCIKISMKELRTILNQNNINKFFLLKYYVYLCGLILEYEYTSILKSKNEISIKLPIHQISKELSLNEKTIYEYNKILKKLGLNYIKNREIHFASN